VPAPVPYANFTNPQTLNLYAMVHDDPETFADLDGHDDWIFGVLYGIREGLCDHPDTGCSTNPLDNPNPKPPGQQPKDASVENRDQQSPAKRGAPEQLHLADYSDDSPAPSAPSWPPLDATGRPIVVWGATVADRDEDKPQTPLAAMGKGGKGGPGKGERRFTGKPDNPRKHVRPVPGKPGRWQVRDPQTGKWIEKPPGWSPETAKKVGIGAAIVAVGAAIIQAIIELAPAVAPAL